MISSRTFSCRTVPVCAAISPLACRYTRNTYTTAAVVSIPRCRQPTATTRPAGFTKIKHFLNKYLTYLVYLGYLDAMMFSQEEAMAMRSRLCNAAAALVTGLALLSASTVALRAETTRERVLRQGTIVVGISNGAPWGFRGKNGEAEGFHPELIRLRSRALASAGWRLS